MWWCAALGWSAAIVTRSPATSRVVLALLWPVTLVATTGAGSVERWLFVQVGWLVMGFVAVLVGWLCLRAPDRVTQGMEEQE